MRIVARIVVCLATSAIALLIAATVLDGFHISALTFPIVVVVFAAISAIVRPVTEALLERNVRALSSFVGLIAAFLTLLVTDILSKGLTVNGVSTWIIGSLIVWGGQVVADMIVGPRLFRRIAREDRGPRR